MPCWDCKVLRKLSVKTESCHESDACPIFEATNLSEEDVPRVIQISEGMLKEIEERQDRRKTAAARLYHDWLLRRLKNKVKVVVQAQ
jgi:hypothetical protein